MTRVLLVDDDVELGEMLTEYLEREGFGATAVPDGEAGVHHALSGEYGIVVLDVMMPRLNGIEALRRIRAQDSRIPVLMLTARGDDVDRIVGLELGADDYVPKPCTPRELVARIRAILRRTQAREPTSSPSGSLTVGSLMLWPEKRGAEWNGAPLELTSTEFNLLEVLVRNAGRVVSKQELSEQGLGRPLARYDRSIDVHLVPETHDRLLVTVADRGPGVPENELQAVFEPFFRGVTSVTTTVGFGLRLAIARRAVEVHDGSIRAVNRPGGGLRVEIALPVGDRS